jgi:hypothetical protein
MVEFAFIAPLLTGIVAFFLAADRRAAAAGASPARLHLADGPNAVGLRPEALFPAYFGRDSRRTACRCW